ncbi:RlpA-like double-psi beta-barrel domain-containing protein [Streptomyces sp. NPDC050674]|uniref:RlpA-like double-psi beta-barrel domain-containing protein n=1 Tax=Streptomyces sp. NPDC050674 TaxID=3157216 RepID=UPI0034210B17
MKHGSVRLLGVVAGVVALLLGGVAPGHAVAREDDRPAVSAQDTYSGQATYYDVGLGACGSIHKNTDFVAALNMAQYSGDLCGRTLRVTGPDGQVDVTVVDSCPGCGHGDLDLSPAAFQKIAPLSAGRVAVRWTFL